MKIFSYVSILLICSLFAKPCFARSKAKSEVKRGNSFYNQDKFQEALKSYEKAILDSPNSDIVNYDLAAGLYKTENYKDAVKHFEKSLIAKDASLEQKANYNLGNSEYKYGISMEEQNLEGAIDLLKHALHHYENAIELDAEDKDAKHNYEFVKKELERLQKKLKKQQKQKKKNQEQKKEQQKQKKQQEREEKKKPSESTAKQGAEREPQKKMTKKEAKALLKNYRQEEEPERLYREKIPVHSLPPVEKDW